MSWNWLIWAALLDSLSGKDKPAEPLPRLFRIIKSIWEFIITVLIIWGIIEAIIWLSSKYG